VIVWSNVSDHFFLRLTCEVVEVVIKLNLIIIIYSLLSCLWLWLPNNNLIIIQTFVRRTLSSIRAESEAPNRTVLMVMIRMVDHFWYQLTVVVMEGGGINHLLFISCRQHWEGHLANTSAALIRLINPILQGTSESLTVC